MGMASFPRPCHWPYWLGSLGLPRGRLLGLAVIGTPSHVPSFPPNFWISVGVQRWLHARQSCCPRRLLSTSSADPDTSSARRLAEHSSSRSRSRRRPAQHRTAHETSLVPPAPAGPDARSAEHRVQLPEWAGRQPTPLTEHRLLPDDGCRCLRHRCSRPWCSLDDLGTGGSRRDPQTWPPRAAQTDWADAQRNHPTRSCIPPRLG